MRKLFFYSIVDATLNRVGSFFANSFLRRMATHVAANEAKEIAEVEAKIAQLKADGNPIAAERLTQHLQALAGDDPSFERTTCFGRQLLADSFGTDTPEMRGDPNVDDDKPRRGRPRTKPNGRISSSKK